MSSAGRLVIPKALRQRWRMGQGARIRVRETETGLLLEPLVDEAEVVDRDGLLVVAGGAVDPDFDWANVVQRSRDDRIRRTWQAAAPDE